MQMCMFCVKFLKHLLRISRAYEEQSFHTWREDEWFRTVLATNRTGATMPETTNKSLIVLQNYIWNSLQRDLYVWEERLGVIEISDDARSERPPIRTPTVDAEQSPIGQLLPAPPTTVPPGLPTPNVAVGGTNTGGGRNDAQGEGGNVAFGPLFGQGEARVDRADVQSQGVSALLERDAKIADLQKQIRELQEQNNLRSSSVSPEAQPGVIPGRFGLLSKAPSQRMQDGTTEAARA